MVGYRSENLWWYSGNRLEIRSQPFVCRLFGARPMLCWTGQLTSGKESGENSLWFRPPG